MGSQLMIGVFGIALLAGLGWLFNHQIQARVNAEVRSSQAVLAQELAERERDAIREDLEEEKVRSAVLSTELQTARVEEQEATKILEDRDRLANALAGRPGLLQIRARAATTKVWETIEAEANARE